ncbi:MAG TPA: TonB-dependent receptor [Terriglobales bacterium]|nr:TonB-dependent receptor [Terriglobales bacterium]
MRPRLIFFLLLLSTHSFAHEVTIKVASPDHQPVGNARVRIFPAASRTATISTVTGTQGETVVDLPEGKYNIEALAPGFARASSSVSVPESSQAAFELQIAGPSQTVQVTATGVPIETAVSGADVSTLTPLELENQQPIALSDSLRVLPGAVLNASGRRGGLTALFVRGGESRFNKVIVDGVPVNEVGGQFNFGTTSLIGADRVEFMRGAQSTLYGSDAMTSVVQVFSAQGTTRTPELRFGAEGGTFDSARGYASLAGAIHRFDYNLFGEQTNSAGQGPNDAYSLSAQGGNIGVTLHPKVSLRLRARHDNARVGVPNAWVYGGQALLPPDLDGFARDNNFLSSLDLTITPSANWRHRFTGYEHNQKRYNNDPSADRGCDFPYFLDCPFYQRDHQNRAGFGYQGEWSPVGSLRTTFGYDFENETGSVDEDFSGFAAKIHGLRRNHAGYVEQIAVWKRLTATAGVRVLHNESFGNRAVPRISLSLLALRGNEIFSGTRFRFTYAEAFKEPTFEESFGVGAFGIIPNPNLRPEENRSFETGFEQSFYAGKYSLSATYFNNRFRNLVTLSSLSPLESQYVNLNRTMAHGAEVGFHARWRNAIRLDASYTHNSTQILSAPLAFDPINAAGRPLLRRPKHAGSLLLNYFGKRWGGNIGGSFIGRRPDSDFLFGAVPPVDHTAGYALVNVGTWYALNSFVTFYANVDNVLNRRYEEVAGYPALKANFRAGMRFRFGGE